MADGEANRLVIEVGDAAARLDRPALSGDIEPGWTGSRWQRLNAPASTAGLLQFCSRQAGHGVFLFIPFLGLILISGSQVH